MPAAAKSPSTCGQAAEHHHQRLMSPRNLSSVGNPFFCVLLFLSLNFS
jgi:hypothetical protein